MNEKGLEESILKKYKHIAVVGISNKQDRDSYGVSKYLVDHGYNVIPINPTFEIWEGLKSYPDLVSASKEHNIEVVDIFRKPDAVLPVVEEAIKVKPEAIWMQLGVINQEAAELAERNNIKVIMDKCIMVEHKKL